MTAKLLSPSRILIVDDHPWFAKACDTRIGAFPDLEICVKPLRRRSHELVKETNPQLIIVDISLKSGHA